MVNSIFIAPSHRGSKHPNKRCRGHSGASHGIAQMLETPEQEAPGAQKIEIANKLPETTEDRNISAWKSRRETKKQYKYPLPV